MHRLAIESVGGFSLDGHGVVIFWLAIAASTHILRCQTFVRQLSSWLRMGTARLVESGLHLVWDVQMQGLGEELLLGRRLRLRVWNHLRFEFGNRWTVPDAGRAGLAILGAGQLPGLQT